MESTMITEPNITSYTFNWKIRRFDIICPANCSQFEDFTSEHFTVKGDDGLETQWSITIGGVSKFINLYLNFKNATDIDGSHPESVFCLYKISICNGEGNKIRKRHAESIFKPKENWGWHQFVSFEELYQKREDLLPNNILHIRIDMQIKGKYSTSVTLFPLLKSEGTISPVETLNATLNASLRELFNNKTNSDVEVVCGSELFYAHKIILSARSKVFAAMLESGMQETATSKIVLTDIDATIFHVILLYIYTGKVEMNDDISYTELIYGAEKYDLAELKHYCFEQMCTSATIDTIGDLAVAAEVYNADEEIRKPIKEYCRRNMAELMKNPAMTALMISHPKAFL